MEKSEMPSLSVPEIHRSHNIWQWITRVTPS